MTHQEVLLLQAACKPTQCSGDATAHRSPVQLGRSSMCMHARQMSAQKQDLGSVLQCLGPKLWRRPQQQKPTCGSAQWFAGEAGAEVQSWRHVATKFREALHAAEMPPARDKEQRMTGRQSSLVLKFLVGLTSLHGEIPCVQPLDQQKYLKASSSAAQAGAPKKFGC